MSTIHFNGSNHGLVEAYLGTLNQQISALRTEILHNPDPRMMAIFNEAIARLNPSAEDTRRDIKPVVRQITKGEFRVGWAEKMDRIEEVFLKDYEPAHFSCPKTHLTFELDKEQTLVRTKLSLLCKKKDEPLVLHGVKEFITLKELRINGKVVPKSKYILSKTTLTILKPPQKQQFTLETVVELNPGTNESGEGLYASDLGTKGHMLSTQCEAQGMRKITYCLDRPDVLSRYEVTLTGDPKLYPHIVSNGNLSKSTTQDNGLVSLTYIDPHPKPTYLFCLVAGDLACVKTTHKQLDRTIQIEAYTPHGTEERVQFMIESAKAALDWDLEKFGREYDLDVLRMVIIPKFNAGAMENKGLLTFNTMVLCSPETATDREYRWAEGTVAHELFHNWSGNRVCPRDWFQITLKEGLTELRNSLFCSERNSQAVTRIEEVRTMRRSQMPEDNSPHAHPVQPQSYTSIDNFYTTTVYDKGQEINRMYLTLAGSWDKFRAGMDRYFDDNDGRAVTVYELLKAHETEWGEDLTQFGRWYTQAGTPAVEVTMEYDEEEKQVVLTLDQSCRATKECQNKLPFVIPFKYGLLSSEGKELQANTLVVFDQATQEIVIDGIETRPIPALNRDFSAPIRVEYDYTDEELCTLVVHDPDPVVQWESGQKLAIRQLQRLAEAIRINEPHPVNAELLKVYEQVLDNPKLDHAFKALLLAIPSVEEIVDGEKIHHYQQVVAARKALRKQIAAYMKDKLIEIEKGLRPTLGYEPSGKESGRRALHHVVMGHLSSIDKEAHFQLIVDNYWRADNLTDRLHALTLLANSRSDAAKKVVKDFYNKYRDLPNVLEHWFKALALSNRPQPLKRIKSLAKKKRFDATNPNHLRALYGAFGRNHRAFHHKTGSGYQALAKWVVEIDKSNHYVAAQLTRLYDCCPKLPPVQRQRMKMHLHWIMQQEGVSSTVKELIGKLLGKQY